MADKKSISSSSLLKILQRHSVVALILPKSFDNRQGIHPVEEYFRSNGIIYYFKEGDAADKKDYVIDLNKVKIKGF